MDNPSISPNPYKSDQGPHTKRLASWLMVAIAILLLALVVVLLYDLLPRAPYHPPPQPLPSGQRLTLAVWEPGSSA